MARLNPNEHRQVTKKGQYQFTYYVSSQTIMPCGGVGIPFLNLKKAPDSLRELIGWAAHAEQFSQPTREMNLIWAVYELDREGFSGMKPDPYYEREPGVYVLFLNRGYDLDRYGLGLRYHHPREEKESGVPLDSRLLINRLSKKSRDLAEEVAPLKVRRGLFSKRVVKANAADLDVYILENGSLMGYGEPSKGLKLYRWRQGEVMLLVHDGQKWRESGSFQPPKM